MSSLYMKVIGLRSRSLQQTSAKFPIHAMWNFSRQ